VEMESRMETTCHKNLFENPSPNNYYIKTFPEIKNLTGLEMIKK